jgi:hypothetical protein
MQFRKSKDPQALLSVISNENASAEQVIGGAELLFHEGSAKFVDTLRKSLLAIGTADAVELAARAALAAEDPASVLAIVSEAAAMFPHGQLPHRMRLLEVNAHLQGGQVGQAVRTLEAIDARDPTDWTRLQIAKIRLSVGDHVGARRLLQTLKPSAPLPSHETVPLAHRLFREAPDIARILLENTNPNDLRATALVPAYFMATDLGIESLAQSLAPDFHHLAQNKQSGQVIVFDRIEDVLQMLQEQQNATDHNRKLWLRGQVPIHVAFDHEPRQFLLATFGRRDIETEWDEQCPMLSRAAIRRSAGVGPNSKSLRLDITAIVLAQRLNILPLIEKLAPIQVPARIAEALTLLIDSIDANAPQLVPTIDAAVARIGRGELRTLDCSDRVLLVLPDNDPAKPLDVSFAALVSRSRDFPDSPLRDWLLSFEPRIAHTVMEARAKFELKAWEAVRLEHLGFLAEFLSRTDSAVSEDAVAYLRNWLLRCKSDCEQLDVLVEARKFVADRLLTSAWRQVVPASFSDKESQKLEGSGPLLHSLLALVKDSKETDTLTWLEDRAVSATATIGNSQGVDVLDVLSSLHDQGHLTFAEYADRYQRLLRYGYSFLPYDINTITALVRNAPVHDGLLLITPELTDLRRHFASQFDRLRFANPTIRGRDEHGSQAELRFGVWLIHLATKMLPTLWADEDANIDEVRLRANWIWENLNVDQSSFLPFNGNSSPELRRVFARQSLVSLITSVLNLQTGTFHSEQTQRRRYSEWLFGHVIGPVEMFHPELVADALKEAAALFASVLLDIDPHDTPGLQREARAMMLRVIHPMPEPWRSRLLDEPSLRSKLALARELVITMCAGVSFSGPEFYHAVGEAFSGSASQIKTREDKAATFSVATDGQITITLSENEKFILADDSLALCRSDVALRRISLERFVKELGFSQAETNSLWVELENETDLSKRFERLHDLERVSYSWRLQRLKTELEGERHFEKDLVTPAAPAEMLRFLCLPENTDASGLSHAFAAVAERTNAFQALKRTAGLPRPFDASTNTLLAAAIQQVDDDTRRHAPSPLYALRIAVALARRAGADWQAAAEDLLRALDNFSELFLSVLQWTARYMLRDPAWLALPPKLRQSLAWLHADIVTAHLVVGRCEAKATAEMFDALDKPGVWRSFDDFDFAVHEIVSFDNVIGFRAWILGLLCAELNSILPEGDLLSRMRKAVALKDGDAWGPQIILLSRPDQSPPFQGASDSVTVLHATGVLTTTTLFDSATSQELLDRLIHQAEQNSSSDVLAILPYFRFRDIPKARLDKVVEVALAYNPFQRFEIGSDAYNLWLNLLSALYGLREDSEGYRAFLDHRIAAIRTAPAHRNVSDLFEAITEGACQFALFLPRSASERLKAFLDALNYVAELCPMSRPCLRRTLSGLVAQIAPEHATSLWDLLMKWQRAI